MDAYRASAQNHREADVSAPRSVIANVSAVSVIDLRRTADLIDQHLDGALDALTIGCQQVLEHLRFLSDGSPEAVFSFLRRLPGQGRRGRIGGSGSRLRSGEIGEISARNLKSSKDRSLRTTSGRPLDLPAAGRADS